MSNYYTFRQKYGLDGQSPYEPMDSTNAIPGSSFAPSLALDMKHELQKQSSHKKPKHPRCCVKPKPCKTWVSFKPEYAGCGDTFVSWSKATDGKYKGCELAPRNARFWVADKRPEIYERSIISGAQWHPEPYAYPHARQLFAQFLHSTKYPDSSPNEKRIDSIDDAYCILKKKYGVPQYTSF